MSPLLALGAGCAVLASTTEIVVDGDARWLHEDVRVEIQATGDCDVLDVVAGPAARVGGIRAKVKPGDGGGYLLSSGRVEREPRGVDGQARVRVHVPELLRGDRVLLDVRRTHAVDLLEAVWAWVPPDDTVAWTLKPPRDLAVDGVAGGRIRGRRVQGTDGRAAVLLRLGAASPRPEPALPAGPTDQTPAEAVQALSTRVLLPEALPLDAPAGATASRVAAHLVARTAEGPTPLVLQTVWDPGRVDPRTGEALAVGRVAVQPGSPPRVWAHPDQRWDPSWTVGPTAAEAVVPVGAPAGDGPALHAPARLTRALSLVVPDGVDPRDALVPGQGSAVRAEDRWTLPGDGPRARLLAVEPGGRVVQARVDGAGGHVRISPWSDQVLLLAEAGAEPTFTVVTETPDAPTAGRAPDLDGVSLDGFTVQGEGADVRTEGPWWWIHAWDDHPLHSEPARVVAGLNARFNRRTVPEPGLPMRVRGRLKGWDLAAEMPDLLRDRAVVADLPVDTTWPRPLHRARRTGAVSPVEAMLIVRAYALQARFETDWALVRPADLGPGHPLVPSAYPAGLLRLQLDGETRWLDPACGVCAPFEVRPELLGADAIGPWVDGTPPPPVGTWTILRDSDVVTWRLEGPAALELRRWLATIPRPERADRLAARLAGEGATLGTVEGATDRGAPITVTATAAAVARIPDPVDVLVPDGEAAFLAWPGVRRWRVEGDEPTERAVTVPVDGRVLDAQGLQVLRDALRAGLP